MTNAYNTLPIKMENPSLFESQGYFAGKWRDAASNWKSFPVIKPSSGQVLAYFANFSQGNFEEAPIEYVEPARREYVSGKVAQERASLLRIGNEPEPSS